MLRRKFLAMLGIGTGVAIVKPKMLLAEAPPQPDTFAWVKAKDLTKPMTQATVHVPFVPSGQTIRWPEYPYMVRASELKQGDLIAGHYYPAIDKPMRVVFISQMSPAYGHWMDYHIADHVNMWLKPQGVKDQDTFFVPLITTDVPQIEEMFMLSAAYPSDDMVEVVGHEEPERIWIRPVIDHDVTPVVYKPRSEGFTTAYPGPQLIRTYKIRETSRQELQTAIFKLVYGGE
jgi:hypothetical protein